MSNELKEKFTPGEWVADIRVGCCAVYVRQCRDEWEQGLHQDDRNLYYSCFPNVATKPELKHMSTESIANAHLIAAAPDMYRELKSVLNCLEWGYSEIDLADNILEYRSRIKELLAKARGEQ